MILGIARMFGVKISLNVSSQAVIRVSLRPVPADSLVTNECLPVPPRTVNFIRYS